MIYKFKEGAHLSGDAQKVGERLAALEAAGRLTAEAVVQDARSDASPLHPMFEWDDAKAADKFRLQQAGHVIRCVTVVMETAEPAEDAKVVRAFVPVSEGEEKRHYVDTVRAMGDEDLRKQVLAQAHSELGAIARRYRELKELAGVVEAIERVGQILKEGQPQ